MASSRVTPVQSQKPSPSASARPPSSELANDAANYGFIQATDRLEGEFTEQDEANLARLATLTSTALNTLAQLHLPE
jgi:hypothetical protein